MALRADSTQWISGALLASKYGGFGVRGDAIPSTGTSGPSPLLPCASLPADNAVEFRGVITRWPTLGTLNIEEDHSFVYTGATDYYEFRLWADGVASAIDVGRGPGIVRVQLNIGPPAPSVTDGYTAMLATTSRRIAYSSAARKVAR